ncbi:uncharacterized protein [Maniola hyperantus]|uniref:uncharacterized protein n=1 Tax=Aphantopus hyperantus TaxID=2795564 RepID=UPI00212853D2
MGLHTVVILVTLGLVWLDELTLAGMCNCKSGSTVIQVLPNRTCNVTIECPNQVDPVKFVPYPYVQSGNRGQCCHCQRSRCPRCNCCKPVAPSGNVARGTKTNIIIDIVLNNKPNKPPKNDTKPDKNNDTVVVVKDKSTANSSSKAVAKVDYGTTIAGALSTSTSISKVIAIGDDGSNGDKPAKQNINVENAAATPTSNDKPAPSSPPQKPDSPPPPPPQKPEPVPPPVTPQEPTPSQPPQQPAPVQPSPDTGEPANQVVVVDKSTTTSSSKAVAKADNGTSTAVASSTSSSNSTVITAISDDGSKGDNPAKQNIYVENDTTSTSNATATATSNDKPAPPPPPQKPEPVPPLSTPQEPAPSQPPAPVQPSPDAAATKAPKPAPDRD